MKNLASRTPWHRSARLRTLAALLALPATLPATTGPSPGLPVAPGAARLVLPTSPVDRPQVGRFDAKGRYLPPPRRERFDQLHRSSPGLARLPIVLVHGIVGFPRIRMGRLSPQYFRGVEKMLRREGLEVLTTRQDNFASIESRARQVKAQIEAAGYQRFNLVAHSMGGLDCRYLITHLGMADRVASLTTVSSPHHGSFYADFALEWVFGKQRFWKVWDLIGFPRDAVPEVSVKYVNGTFNPTTPDMPQVRYFSLGGYQPFWKTLPPFSTMTMIQGVVEKLAIRKPLNLRERVMAWTMLPRRARRELKQDALGLMALDTGQLDWIDPKWAGKNDALIPVSSARWGEYLGTLKADHIDQMGWLTLFDHKRFYRGVARMLGDAGY